MRIGIEAQRLFRRNKHGMEIVALELIRELQKIDRDNEYIIFTRGDDDQCLRETSNFRVVRIPAFSYAEWEQLRLPRWVKKEKVDLLHCTANTAPLYSNIPLILTLHDIIYLESLNFSGSAYQNFGNIYRRLVVPRCAKRARVITVSEFERDRISETLKINTEDISVVYNAINSQFENKTDVFKRREVLSKYELPDSYLLFFGNTAPKKNTSGVLEAYCKYCNSGLSEIIPLVVTDCTSGYIYKMLEELGCTKLMKNIIVKDYISFFDLPYIYSSARIFLYPSFRESFGMPIIEAMACGTPVITSKTSSMPEIAGQAALLVDPFRPEEIADGLFELLSNQPMSDRLVEAGLENIKRFSWEKSASQLKSIYESVASFKDLRSSEVFI